MVMAAHMDTAASLGISDVKMFSLQILQLRDFTKNQGNTGC